MDIKYLKRFLIIVGCLFVLTIVTAYYFKTQLSIFDEEFVTLDKVDTVFFHHSLESDTYSSSEFQNLQKVHTFLKSLKMNNTRNFEKTTSYYEVIFSGNNNLYRKSYKFYNNGYVEVTENAAITTLSSVYKLKNERDLDLLIKMFE